MKILFFLGTFSLCKCGMREDFTLYVIKLMHIRIFVKNMLQITFVRVIILIRDIGSNNTEIKGGKIN